MTKSYASDREHALLGVACRSSLPTLKHLAPNSEGETRMLLGLADYCVLGVCGVALDAAETAARQWG